MQATATQRQSRSRMSSQSSDQLTPCSAHARQASERTIVRAPKIPDLLLLLSEGGGTISPEPSYGFTEASPGRSRSSVPRFLSSVLAEVLGNRRLRERQN